MAKKRKHPGITEKRLNNKRFRKTEEAILRAFFDCKAGMNATAIARRAGVRRSTVYHHHAGIRELLPDYKRYIAKSHGRMMRRALEKKQVRMRNIYLMNLAFIMRHRWIFAMLLRVQDREMLHRMIERLRGKIERFARLPRDSERMFRVYQGEVVAVIEGWGAGGFEEDEVLKVLDDIMYLTETMRERLGPLGRK